jgi:hypothetical protein
MNERDSNNLAFIMSLSKAGFDEWMRVATDDDIDYALELIAQHRMYLHSILRIDNLAEIDSSVAADYLKKFTLNPNTRTV